MMLELFTITAIDAIDSSFINWNLNVTGSFITIWYMDLLCAVDISDYDYNHLCSIVIPTEGSMSDESSKTTPRERI